MPLSIMESIRIGVTNSSVILLILKAILKDLGNNDNPGHEIKTLLRLRHPSKASYPI